MDVCRLAVILFMYKAKVRCIASSLEPQKNDLVTFN